jgi:Protein of unknown function (DUF4235)
MLRALYKPLGALMGALGGVVAGALFKRIWRIFSDEPKPPTATQAGRSWKEVLAAAAIQGAVFALVKAVVDRGGATAFEKATGVWPGERPDEQAA